jgi:hypothetical protein
VLLVTFTLFHRRQIMFKTVTRRALVQRINRKLAPCEEKLHTARGARTKKDFGDFYIVQTRTRFLVQKDVNLAELATELGALKPSEQLEQE